MNSATDFQDDELVDAAIAALAVPAPRDLRSSTTWKASLAPLTATPRRAALCTLWATALVLGLVSAIKTSVTVQTALGPATAHCGLDVFVYGYPDGAVTHACRHVEASRAGVFVPCAIVVIAGLLAAAMIAVQRRRSDGRLSRTVHVLGRAPLDAALIVLGALGVLGGVLALRPATVQVTAGGSLTTARCGIDTYLFGYPDPTVQHACDRAFAGHAHILVGVAILAGIGFGALVHLLRGFGTRRLVACAFGLGLAVVVVAALRPVAVSVTDNGAVATASCGLDSYVAGYPDPAVQQACRSHDATHAAAALGALALGVVGLGASFVTKERQHG